MKIAFLILLFALVSAPGLRAQGCSTFECAIQAAEKWLNSPNAKDKYEKALSNLDDAEDFAGSDLTKKNQVKSLRKRAFAAIQKEKERADNLLLVAEKNTRAAENAALAVAVSQKNSTLAAQMLEYNRTRHPDNLPTLINYYRILSDTMHPFYYLEWSGNENDQLSILEGGKTMLFNGRLWDLTLPKDFPGAMLAGFPGDDSVSCPHAIDASERLAFVGVQKEAALWDLKTKKELLRLSGHHGIIRRACISPNGKWAMTEDDTGLIKCWDLAQAKALMSMENPVSEARVFDDGSLAVISYGRFMVYEMASGELRSNIAIVDDRFREYSLGAISPDGTRAALSTDDGIIHIFDFTDGKKMNAIFAHSDVINKIIFSEDGKKVASCSGYTYGADFSTRIFDVSTGKLIRELLLEDEYFTQLMLSKDLTKIVTSNSQSFYIWDIETDRKESDIYIDSMASIFSRKLKEPGKWLVATSGTNWGVWDQNEGKFAPRYTWAIDTLTGVSFNTDKKICYTLNGTGLFKAWGASDGKMLWELKVTAENPENMNVTKNGKILVFSTGKAVEFWDTALKKRIRRYSLSGENDFVTKAVLTADDKFVMVVVENFESNEFEIKLIQLSNGVESKSIKLKDSGFISSISTTPDGMKALITSGSADDSHIMLWDIQENQMLQDIYEIRVMESVCLISNDGKLLITAGGWSGIIRLWNASTGKLLRQFRLNHGDETLELNDLSLSEDGKMIVASTSDGYIQSFCINLECGDQNSNTLLSKLDLEMLRNAGMKLEPKDLLFLQQKGIELNKSELQLINR